MKRPTLTDETTDDARADDVLLRPAVPCDPDCADDCCSPADPDGDLWGYYTLQHPDDARAARLVSIESRTDAWALRADMLDAVPVPRRRWGLLIAVAASVLVPAAAALAALVQIGRILRG